MSILRILTFCLLLFAGNAFSQGFLRSYTPESSMAREILQTADGGYFLAGQVSNLQSLFLARTNEFGQILWENHIPINQSRAIASCAATDGGFFILLENYWSNSENRNAVLKLDASGAIQWTTVVPNVSIANGLSDLILLAEGNLMIAGTTRDANFNTRNWLVKIDPDGNILWEKIFGIEGRVIKKIIELPGGDFVVSGHLTDLYLARLNSGGDLIWERNFHQPLNQISYDLLATTDGNIALLGTTPNMSAGTLEVCLLKTNLNGTILWFKTHYPFQTGSNTLPVVNAFTQDEAGNFYIPLWGFVDDPLDTDLELLKLTSEGNPLWKHSLQMPGNALDILETADNYLAIVGDNNGAPTNALFLKTDLEGDFLSNKILGSVYRDEDVDCLFTPGEPGLRDFIVKAENALGEVFYKKTSPDGSYAMQVTEGDFTITTTSAFAPPSYYATCDTQILSVLGVSQTFNASAIGVDIWGACPLLFVEVSGGILRRCTATKYTINWCNLGTFSAENTLLQVIMDPNLDYLSSSLPLASQSGDTLSFSIGLVPAGACNSMSIQYLVNCAANLSDILCVEAHITPDSSCLPQDNSWDGSIIEVSGECDGTEIEFVLKNTGTGDMSQVAEYVIIEDQIMYMQPPLQLAAGEQMTSIRIPMPEDSCFALQVFPNQTSLLKQPVAVVANCTANGNLSLLLDLPSNENELAVSVHCDEVVGSFDPNDKVGFPQGITPAHFIEQGQEIEYRIRFQNTGNDTAFLVRILDTLPVTLDPATIRPMGASHPFTWDVTNNGWLTFTFANILLPDSTTNEPGSHGYVSFRVGQRPNLADWTLLENSASIYFDFNEPILTNTWYHTIGRPTTVSTQTPGRSDDQLAVLVSPNPMAEEALFTLQGYSPKSILRFELIDPIGRILREERFTGSVFSLKKQALNPGLYFWKISEGRKTLSRGRLAVE